MSCDRPQHAEKQTKLFATLVALLFVFLIAIGIFAKNGWFPSGPDPFTGKRTGWFTRPLARNASSSWNPIAAPLPNPTPQLSREYIHAGSRLLAVQDANANAAPPADLAVWRPSTGTWWVMGGRYSEGATQTWGLADDKPAPGDYDGDGKTDFSVFRPSTGEWFVLQSSDGSWLPVYAWGTATDKLVPADYDGDGKTDRAVWRPSTGLWYIVKSSDGASSYLPYGNSGDLPLPGDYDGDGLADLGLWRNSNKTFYSLDSSNNSSQTIPTPIVTGSPAQVWEAASSDYDGDGRAEYALYDKTESKWYIRKDSDGSIEITLWGSSGDTPVHNDYDGDGKCDIATWRDSSGNWYIRQSASGNSLRQVQWGIPGDIPVPAYYRR